MSEVRILATGLGFPEGPVALTWERPGLRLNWQ